MKYIYQNLVYEKNHSDSFFFYRHLFLRGPKCSIGTNTPNSSALLELQSTNKGLLIPRMSATQRLGIPGVNGLLVYDLDSSSLFIYESSAWKRIRSLSNLESLITGSNPGDLIQWNGTNWVILPNIKYALTITKVNGGETSVVTSSISGVYCGVDCSESYNSGTVITLTATPGTGYTFAGWSGGGCSGTGSCVVTMDAAKSVTATFTPSLTVSKTGTAGGTITSTPAGINCGGTCSANFLNGTSVTLTASPNSDASFLGWSGACTGTGACNVTMDAVKNVTAIFTKQQYNVNINRDGNGTGTVSSTPAGISCGATCVTSFDAGSNITLTATPSLYSSFSGWSGACTGTGSCVLSNISSIQNVTATFTKPQYTLSTLRSGPGTITSSPSGIICQPACSNTLDAGTLVSLTAVPDAGASFGDWSGACSGSGACNVTLDANKTVNARFGYLLSVNLTGGVGGNITSSVSPPGSPGSINCPSVCNSVFNPSTVVTLSQSPASGATFIGWSGACSGTGSCVVTMNAAQTVNASYTFPLTVTRTNNMGGTITSDVAGINCGGGGSCVASYVGGTVVNLTQTPDPTAIFAGWSGDCSGTGGCTVSMNQVRNVTATYKYTLSVSKTGPGSGTVTSNPVGINCGSTCSNTFTAGTLVTLTATPAGGSTFTGWGGACSGTGSCTVTMDAAKSVSANFN